MVKKLTDEELMDMVGGFNVTKTTPLFESSPIPLYGITPKPSPQPLYGITPPPPSTTN